MGKIQLCFWLTLDFPYTATFKIQRTERTVLFFSRFSAKGELREMVELFEEGVSNSCF